MTFVGSTRSASAANATSPQQACYAARAMTVMGRIAKNVRSGVLRKRARNVRRKKPVSNHKTLYPALPAETVHCGYFTGDTTPAGCKALMERYRAAIRVATSAQNLCHFMRKSLDVGPRQSTSPRHETWHWVALQSALAEFNSLVSESKATVEREG